MAFPDSELQRILPEKLFELYEHIRQRRDIELAGLEGLEECPFCDYKVVIDADFQTDKVLRCQNEECAKVSCRKCKKEVGICAKLNHSHLRLLTLPFRITCRNLVKVCMISCVYIRTVFINYNSRDGGRYEVRWKARYRGGHEYVLFRLFDVFGFI